MLDKKLKKEIMESIESIDWPKKCKQIVKPNIWDYREVVIYFEELLSSSHIDEYINTGSRFGYMISAVTKGGLLYLLPTLMPLSIEDTDSELSSGLWSALKYREKGSSVSHLINYERTSQEQKELIAVYLAYMNFMDSGNNIKLFS